MRPLADVQDEHVDVQSVPGSSDLASLCQQHGDIPAVSVLQDAPWPLLGPAAEPVVFDTSQGTFPS